ncbi:MAG: Fic family protein [Candidatus Omnitrophica bacterium]|nr:Fic family protein [Candidatus Omnitrophota bacterium]
MKYETSRLIEDQYQPGSRGRVLENLLSINKKRDIDRLEAREYLRTIQEISKLFSENHCFIAEDICQIHHIWLGKIYSWAGRYRQVNISKGGFPFAMSKYVPALMQDLERGPLSSFTPCRYKSTHDVAQAIATVHTELVLVHPFREGNGRLARLLSILMGWQARLPTLDFSQMAGKRREKYFAAVRAGLRQDYQPMTEIFEHIIEKTLNKSFKT